SARAVVHVVLSLADAGAQLRAQRWAGAIEACMDVERGLVNPALQQHDRVRVSDALEGFELLAARLFHRLRAAGLVRLRELCAFSRCRVDRYHESNGHVVSLSFTNHAFAFFSASGLITSIG